MPDDETPDGLEERTTVQQSDTTPPDAPESPTSDFMNDPDVIAYIEKKVAEGVTKALIGKAPRMNTVNVTEAEKAIFEKMTYKDRLRLYQSNPLSYQKLAKGSI